MKTVLRNAYLIAICLMLPVKTLGYDPPKGLTWGMSYERAKAHLLTLPKDDRSELGKPKVFKGSRKGILQSIGFFPIIPEAQTAEFKKNLKIAEKKVNHSFLIFHPDSGLCSVWYQVMFTRNDANEAWSYFKKVQTLLTAKYGKPDKGVPIDMPVVPLVKGSPYRSIWVSGENGQVMVLTIQRAGSLITFDSVELQYCTADFYRMVEDQIQDKLEEEELL